MINPVSRFDSPQTIFPVWAGQRGSKAFEPQGGFLEELKVAVADVNKLHTKSQQAQTDLVVGKAESLHEVMIAVEKAAVATELAVAVRTIIMDGYRDIMRMQV